MPLRINILLIIKYNVLAFPDTTHPPGFPPYGMPMIPPDANRLPPEWSEHQTPDGRTYYHNSLTQESVWERPVPKKPNINTEPPGLSRS